MLEKFELLLDLVLIHEILKIGGGSAEVLSWVPMTSMGMNRLSRLECFDGVLFIRSHLDDISLRELKLKCSLLLKSYVLRSFFDEREGEIVLLHLINSLSSKIPS